MISTSDILRVFETELKYIKNTEIRDWTIRVLEIAEDGFWTRPASKSGRYHPIDECKEGGQIIHTKRVVATARILCHSEQDMISSDEQDYVISACILHDLLHGRWHEALVAPFITTKISKEWAYKYPIIIDCIECHMGRFGERRPSTKLENIVHYADNIAAHLQIILPRVEYCDDERPGDLLL